jgi:hypothetical protein
MDVIYDSFILKRVDLVGFLISFVIPVIALGIIFSLLCSNYNTVDEDYNIKNSYKTIRNNNLIDRKIVIKKNEIKND